MGVRYLDIRLANLNGSNDVAISYNGVDFGSSLNDVLNDCRNFLSQYSSETIIIHLKNERNCVETSGSDCSNKRKVIVNNLISNNLFIKLMPINISIEAKKILCVYSHWDSDGDYSVLSGRPVEYVF